MELIWLFMDCQDSSFKERFIYLINKTDPSDKTLSYILHVIKHIYNSVVDISRNTGFVLLLVGISVIFKECKVRRYFW